MNARLLILAVVIGFTSIQAADETLVELDLDTVAEDVRYLAPFVQAVGMVQIQTSKTAFRLQSGFFCAPKIFVTASSPKKDAVKMSCDREVWIATGKIPKTGYLPKTHRCLRVLGEDPSRGYAVLEVDKASPQVLPISKRRPLAFKSELLAALGYAEGGGLMYASRARVLRTTLGVSDYNGFLFAPAAWGSATCTVTPGMMGGPLLVRDAGKWHAGGILYTLGTATDTVLFATSATEELQKLCRGNSP